MYYTLTNSTLSFVLEGSEQVYALRAKVDIPKDTILEIQWHDTFSDWNNFFIRMPGSYLPKWIMAGSYWTDNGWEFVFCRKPRGFSRPILYNVVVITTNQNRYKRLVIELSKEKSDEIIMWWKEKN